MSTSLTSKAIDASVTRYMLAGSAVLFFMVGGFGVWAATTEISGAVLASGLVVVETNVKKVQHPTGGVVGDIRVKNGSLVQAGDLLIRLDETVTRASLQMVSKQLDELLIRESRLKAERDRTDDMTIPTALASRAEEPDIREIVRGERSLFVSQRDSIDGQKKQLEERSEQLENELTGIAAQIEAKKQEIVLIADELSGLAVLEEKQLVTTTKVAALKREKARLEGELGQYQASAAQTRGRVAEILLQIARLDSERSTEIGKELRDTQSKIAELTERRTAAEDQLRRIEIRAPQSGMVHQLSVFTVGGVINPGEPVMLIVPQGDRLLIEARVPPQDIDQIHIGQKAWVHFATFDQRTTPQVNGEVLSVSADLLRDQVTGEAFFTVRVVISDDELKRLGNNRLLPGMPADVQLRTQDRTALSYLIKPLTDQITKAFRER